MRREVAFVLSDQQATLLVPGVWLLRETLLIEAVVEQRLSANPDAVAVADDFRLDAELELRSDCAPAGRPAVGARAPGAASRSMPSMRIMAGALTIR